MVGYHATKWETILCMFSTMPEKWLGPGPIDPRDQALITAARQPFLRYGSESYLRSMYVGRAKIPWVVESDELCKQMVLNCGGQTVGYNMVAQESEWTMAKVSVNVKAMPGLNWDWGMIGTCPCHVRIFKGPPETCPAHTWDVMILRKCQAHTSSLYDYAPVADKYWDILCVKCCEDSDHPWLIAAIKDIGDIDFSAQTCECKDCYKGTGSV